MKRKKELLVVFVALVLLLLPLLGACAPKTAAPPRAEKPAELVYYHIGDITGPYAPITGAAATAALEDWSRWKNEQGGVLGVPVRIELTDTRNEREAAVAAYNRYREEKPICYCIHQGADIDMLKERCAEDKVPAVCTSPTTHSCWPPGWMFQSLCDYADFSGLFLDWLSAEWEKTGETRKCRVGWLLPDLSWAHSTLTPAVEEYIEAKGNLELVIAQWFDFRAVDISTDVMAVMAANPDWVYTGGIAAQPNIVLKSAEAVGAIGKWRWAFNQWATGPEVSRITGPELVEGVIGQLSYACWADDTPAVREVKAQFKRSNRTEDERTMVYFVFWTVCEMFCEAAEIAVNEWGWENLDGAHMYEAFRSMRACDVAGLQPFTFAPGKVTPREARMFEFRDGEPIPITDYLDCPDLRPAEFRTAEYGWDAFGWPKGWPK